MWRTSHSRSGSHLFPVLPPPPPGGTQDRRDASLKETLNKSKWPVFPVGNARRGHGPGNNRGRWLRLMARGRRFTPRAGVRRSRRWPGRRACGVGGCFSPVRDTALSDGRRDALRCGRGCQLDGSKLSASEKCRDSCSGTCSTTRPTWRGAITPKHCQSPQFARFPPFLSF